VVSLGQPGSLDLAFDPLAGFNGQVADVVVQPDGKIICVGNFSSYRGVARSCIARLDPDGGLDPTFNVGSGFTQSNIGSGLMVNVVRLLPTGKVLCAGGFSHFNGTPRQGLVRLEANGTVDNGFVVPFNSSNVIDVEVTSIGSLFVYGEFNIGQQGSTANLARLNADGSLDISFNIGTGLDGTYLSGGIALSRNANGLEDGGLIYAGNMTTFNGQFFNKLLRLNADGSRDNTFNSPAQTIAPAVPPSVYDVDYDKATNKYYVCGDFTTFGSAAGGLVRIGLNGQRDATFTAAFNGPVASCYTSPSNPSQVYVSGYFTAYTTGGTVTCNGLARVTASGVFDTSFNTGTAFLTSGAHVLPGPVGSIYAFGPFTSYNGTTRNRICRINGLPAGTTGTLAVTTGANGTQTTLRLYDAFTGIDVAAGGGYASNTTTTVNVPLPAQGSLRLRFDDSGNNGLPGGGWVLRNAANERILDNTGNGGCFTAQTTSQTGTIDFPMGAIAIRTVDQDVLDWNHSQVIQCGNDAAVTAQWGVGNQTDDGYEFWFFSPCNSYSKRIFRKHSESAGQSPANADRARKCPLSFVTDCPIKSGELLNVRVRPVVNGVYGNWGPACRFKLTAIPHNSCTTTQLTTSTCGNSYTVNNSSVLSATPAWVTVPPGVGQLCDQLVQANKYAFKFQSGGFIRYQYSNTPYLTLLTSVPANQRLRCGTRTYDVSVAVSFDGGTNYCAFGPTCQVTITANSPNCTNSLSMPLQDDPITAALVTRSLSVDAWPNPLRGEALQLRMTGLVNEDEPVNIQIVDALGRTFYVRNNAAVGSGIIHINEAATWPQGTYLLRVRSGETMQTKAFVVE
jgi:uncharacterized delta-60 repeat protein